MFKKKDVENIALLSKLEVQENECEKMVHQFNDLIQFVDKIQSAEILKKETKRKINKNRIREDKIKEGIQIKKIEELAPQFSSGNIVVPAVIE